jgi:branched-chain amino acid transport system substrate-binding protein
VLLALAAAAFALLAAACGDDDSADAGTAGGAEAAGEPIKIGTITSITGFGGVFEPYFEGLKAFVEHTNANGGIDGRPLELVAEDDAGDPAKNAALARKLVEQDGVVQLVGQASIGAPGSQKYLAEKGLSNIGGWAADAIWTESNMFANMSGPNLPAKCPGFMADAAKAEGATKVAFIGLDFPLGRLDIDCHAAKGDAIGLDAVTGTQYASLTQADFRPMVKRAMDAGAEDILASVGVGDYVKIVQAGEQLGFEGRYFTTGGLSNAAIDGIGDLTARVDGRLFGTSFGLLPDPESPNEDMQNFLATVNPDYADDLNAFPGWAAGIIFAEAVEAAGLDPKAIYDHMYTLEDYDARGTIGPLTFTSGEPHPPTRCILRIQWKDGAFAPAPSQGEGFSCSEYIDAS